MKKQKIDIEKLKDAIEYLRSTYTKVYKDTELARENFNMLEDAINVLREYVDKDND